jgi:hypothetical protein
VVNRVDRTVNVTALWLFDDSGGLPVEIPVERSLAAGEATSVQAGQDTFDGVPLAGGRLWPVYSVPRAQPAELEEIRSYVEDIRMSVVLMDLVDHPAHQVSRLDVRVQLLGASAVQEVPMTGSPASGSASFVLPLTSYLQQRVIRYQVTLTRADSPSTDSAWLSWDVADDGSLISLTWESLGFV